MVRRSSLAVLAVVFAVGAVRVEAGQTAYAQGNFFLAKNQLSAVNYRAGTMLPVGTKVDVVKVADNSVRCKVLDTGVEFEFVSHKSLGRSARDLFKGFFAEQDPAAKLAALAPDTQRLVKAGELAVGMTRDEVLLAMGPPPPHKTVSLGASKWIYWKSKLATVEVTFDDAGKVSSFGDPEKAEKKPFLGGLFEKKPEEPKEVLWAKSNLHHEEGTLSWVNYQHGPIIPFNAKIEVLDKGSSSVKFRVVGESQTYVFENDKRSGKDVWALFLASFATEDQAPALAKLTPAERSKVAAAELEPGMTREAVRMAWGPPPPHATPAFESSTWTYWTSKTAKVAVKFKGDKLESVSK